MSKTGLIKRLFNYFQKGGISIQKQYVGKDSHGNTYFLRHGDPAANIREARWVEPSQEVADGFHDELTMNIPQEWDAWLRKRRNEPPSPEEIEANMLKQMKVKQRVERLKELEKMEKAGSETEQTTLAQDISGDTSKRPFPKYAEYEISPGQTPSKFKTGR